MRLPAPKMCAIQSGQAGVKPAGRALVRTGPWHEQPAVTKHALVLPCVLPFLLPHACTCTRKVPSPLQIYIFSSRTTASFLLLVSSPRDRSSGRLDWTVRRIYCSPTTSGQPGEGDFLLPCAGTPPGPSSSASWTERHSGDNLGSAKSWGIWDLQQKVQKAGCHGLGCSLPRVPRHMKAHHRRFWANRCRTGHLLGPSLGSG
jgi:hypothetical protein